MAAIWFRVYLVCVHGCFVFGLRFMFGLCRVDMSGVYGWFKVGRDLFTICLAVIEDWLSLFIDGWFRVQG